VAADVDAREAAAFIKATLVGIKVSARAGASPESLRGIARMAFRSLR
jgi:TetR/AcrR family transcriptional repressor of nem operon